MRELTFAQLQERLKQIRLFLTDVDGVMTDASIYVGTGLELKRFNILDGLGMVLLRKSGIPVGWVSSRPSPATTARAEELGIDHLHQAPGSKVEAIEGILAKAGVSWEQTCYMGDDLYDLGALNRAGVAVSVPNGLAEARKLAHYVTSAPGGGGAIREVAELILKAQNHWKSLIEANSK